MLNVDLVGGCASFRQALGRDASPVRRGEGTEKVPSWVMVV